jgi:hypothetical protein
MADARPTFDEYVTWYTRARANLNEDAAVAIIGSDPGISSDAVSGLRTTP